MTSLITSSYFEPKEARLERLTAIGYCSAAVVAGVAIWAFSVGISFWVVGFTLAQYYCQGAGLAGGLIWLGTTLFTSMGLGALISLYPIKKVASYFFQAATEHWHRADLLLKKV